jgi:hypothetical protein
LKKALAHHLSGEKFDLQSLLMRHLTSNRERAKAIEHLEPIKGQDVPFVLSILMEARISGSLNLVSDAGEIYGVTLVGGTIAEVDSNDSQSNGVLTLISRGYLAQEDWDEFTKDGGKKVTLERLVNEGLISPHAIGVAKHEQILADFRTICSAASIQLNFVPGDDNEEPPKHAVTLPELLKVLSSAMGEIFPEAHLSEFYSTVAVAPMRLTKPVAELSGILKTVFPGLQVAIESGLTLEQVLTKHPDNSAEIYAGLHFLVLCRALTFEDMQLAGSMFKMMERYHDLYLQLKDATPDKVFRYFGGVERPSPTAVEKIYDDYIRSNHPDQLPKQAPAELKDLVRKCFDIVTAAKEVMSNEGKRSELFDSLKKADAQRVRRSNELTVQGLDVLRKGQFAQALEILQ